MGPALYKNYLLGLLTLIALSNYVDRVALGIVLQDIKLDFDLTDTQLGLLSGIAFALFYSVMGIPIARWADRGNRVTIISLTALLWSAGVALCSVAGSFAQLLLIRVGVAVGEAGCVPPAYSLLADYFNRSERPRASAIYGMSGALSLIVGFFMAGWLNERYGWRTTFVLLALPGLALAVIARFTLREPRLLARAPAAPATAAPSALATPSMAQPNLREVALTLLRNVTFRHLVMCQSVIFLFGYGILQWQPTFFIRSHGFTSEQIGVWLAFTYGIGGLIGAYTGGEMASRRGANNEPWQLKGMAWAIAVAGLLISVTYLTSNLYLAFGALTLHVLALYTLAGPLLATIQTLVPERMRAVAVALVFLVANLVGMGFGPLLTGALSDTFRASLGEESLRYALLSLAPGYFWGAWHSWRASQSVASDLAKARIET